MKPSELPPRYLKVLRGIATGKPRKEVADDSGVSLAAVQTYLRDAYRLLGVHSQVQAINALRQDEPQLNKTHGKPPKIRQS